MKRTKSIFKCVSALFIALSIFAVSCEEEAPKPVNKTQKVTDVTITSESHTVTSGGQLIARRGDTIILNAVVSVENGADNLVDWLLNGDDIFHQTAAGSILYSDSNQARLEISNGETETSIIVTAVSRYDQNKSFDAIVKLSSVKSITINGPQSVNPGRTAQFSAEVELETGAPETISKAVTWSVVREDGNQLSGTSINSSTGLLTVGQNETVNAVLVVTARAAADTQVTSEAKLTVNDPSGTAVVYGVEVYANPTIENNIVLRKETYTFRAIVDFSGSASEDVTWSLSGGGNGTVLTKGQDNSAQLYVAENQTPGVELTITAASAESAFTSISGFTKVTVATPTRLYTPAELTFDEQGLASWSHQGNTSLVEYSVQLLKGSPEREPFGSPVKVSKDNHSHSFLEAMKAGGVGVYAFNVTAIADGINYTNSETSIESEMRTVRQRNKPTNPVLTEDYASWEGDAGNFIVKLFRDNKTTALEEITVDSGMSLNLYNAMTKHGNGYYSFTVTALGDGYIIFPSDESVKSEKELFLRSLWISGTGLSTGTSRQMTTSVGMFTWAGNAQANAKFSFSFNSLPNTDGYWFVPSAGGQVDIVINGPGNSAAEVFGNTSREWNIPAAGYYQVEFFPETMKMVVYEGTPPGKLVEPSAPTFAPEGMVTWTYAADANAIGYILRLYNGTGNNIAQLGNAVQITKGDEEYFNRDTSIYSYNFRNAVLEEGPGTYRVTVQAMGNGKEWGDSEESARSTERVYTRLENPSQSSRVWAGTEIRWSAVTGASGYEVIISKKNNDLWDDILDAPIRVTGTSVEAAAHLASRDYGGTGTYSFRLRTLGSGLNLDAENFTTSEHERFHLMLDVSESGGVFGSSQIYSIAYGGNGLFVAVGNERKIMRSTDYGVSWTLVADGENDLPATMRSVAYGNNMFIAVGSRGTIMSSPTGETWTNVPNPFTTYATPPDLRGVTFGDGRFMAVGTNSREVDGSSRVNRVIHSQNGTTWNVAANGSTEFDLNSVTYGNGRFVAVGPTGRLTMSNENDHATWVRVSDSILNSTSGSGGVPANAIAFGNGRFVIVGNGGNVARASTTLTTHAGWIRSTLPAEFSVSSTDSALVGICDIVYAEDVGLFFAVMHNGRIGTSPTGEIWTSVPRGDGGDGTTRFTGGEGIFAISYGSGRFVFGGNSYSTGTQSKIAYSY